ncbi:hypothetical protein RCL1_005837 [Eukaryota sp. TZLM3-RCL]
MSLTSRVETIHIDAKTVLKLIKYGLSFLPGKCRGQLLGMENDSVLEITDCFPVLTAEDAGVLGRLLEPLRSANWDFSVVGHFQCANLGTYLDMDLLKDQFKYQEDMQNMVSIVVDPESSANGQFLLRAFQLSDKFLECYSHNNFYSDSLTEIGLNYTDIWRELPVFVKNSSLVNVWLSQYRLEHGISRDASLLAINPQITLNQTINTLKGSVDALGAELRKFVNQANTVSKTRDRSLSKKTRAVGEPSHLLPMVSMSQLERGCDFLERQVVDSVSTLDQLVLE